MARLSQRSVVHVKHTLNASLSPLGALPGKDGGGENATSYKICGCAVHFTGALLLDARDAALLNEDLVYVSVYIPVAPAGTSAAAGWQQAAEAAGGDTTMQARATTLRSASARSSRRACVTRVSLIVIDSVPATRCDFEVTA